MQVTKALPVTGSSTLVAPVKPGARTFCSSLASSPRLSSSYILLPPSSILFQQEVVD